MAEKRNSISKIVEPAPRFAQGLCFDKLFWIFVISAFLGVVVETGYAVFVEHEFENRSGLLYGPFNIIYGMGGVLLTLVLSVLPKFLKKWYGYFIVAMILGAAVEFAFSYGQELVFGSYSWEYNDTFLNIGGRVNLMFSFFWGVLGLAWMLWIYPLMSKLIEKIPVRLGRVLTIVLIVFFVLDMALSSVAVWRYRARYDRIPPQNAIDRLMDEWYPDERMQIAYPNATFIEKEA